MNKGVLIPLSRMNCACHSIYKLDSAKFERLISLKGQCFPVGQHFNMVHVSLAFLATLFVMVNIKIIARARGSIAHQVLRLRIP